ncbi:MAG TPA: hypothetical protein VE871_05805 [Longimicrobium sp.]|nr:hypothetical protein [Longimicrobium sp.]
MKKLRLDVDSLAVVSFEAVTTELARGAVEGHLVPTNPWCAANSYRSYCPDSRCTCPPPVD